MNHDGYTPSDMKKISRSHIASTKVMGVTQYSFFLLVFIGIALFSLVYWHQHIAPQAFTFFGVCFALLVMVFLWRYHRLIRVMDKQSQLQHLACEEMSSFYAFLKQDGTVDTIATMFEPLWRHFREHHESDLAALKTLGNISEDDLTLLRHGLSENESVTITMQLPDQEGRDSFFTLVPIKGLPSKKLKGPADEYFLLRKSIPEEHDDLGVSFGGLFPFAHFVTDESYVLTYYNDAFRQSFITSEENHPNLASLFENKKAFKQFLREEAAGHVVRLRDKFGQFQTYILYFSPEYYQGVVAPLTEKVTGVMEQEAIDKLPDILHNSPIATAIINAAGKVESCNDVFTKLTGIKEGKRGNNLLSVIDESHLDEVRHLIDRFSDKQYHQSRSIDIHLKGNDANTTSLYLNNVTNYGQNLSKQLLVHLIDKTELKNLELRFAHSQKMQAVGQLAGGIAHDFNNLLTAMIGFCDLLLVNHPAGDPSFSNIMQIKQNANRAANLIRQLLAFSRKQTLQPTTVNITETLADLSNLIGRLIGERITLEMLHGDEVGYTKADQGQLEQVIVNLAVNARDAMEEGGNLTIQTTLCEVDRSRHSLKSLFSPPEEEDIEPGHYIRIDVSDTGCGIEKKHLRKIFEPFYSTKQTSSGTGLGLATVYGIIKQSGGYIYVSSKRGKGTTFSLFLKQHVPLAEEPISYVTKKETLASSDEADLNGSGTILLVEDEAPVRMFSVSALVNKGYQVIDVDSGEAALEVMLSRGDEIDVIISDVIMPGIKGPEMAKQIRQTHPDIKIVFISGYGEDSFISTFGKERHFHFLSKPFTLKQLAQKVKEVLEE